MPENESNADRARTALDAINAYPKRGEPTLDELHRTAHTTALVSLAENVERIADRITSGAIAIHLLDTEGYVQDLSRR